MALQANPSGARRLLLISATALVGAALNFALGTLNHLAGLPLYFDSIFTMAVAALFGLWPGLVAALATNGLLALFRDVPLPFALCNASTAIIVAAMRRGRDLDALPGYLWMGLWTGIANAVLGSFISAFVFGGRTALHRIDDLVAGFVIAGQSILSSVFLAGLLTNLVDKLLSAVAAYGLALAAPFALTRGRTNSGPS